MPGQDQRDCHLWYSTTYEEVLDEAFNFNVCSVIKATVTEVRITSTAKVPSGASPPTSFLDVLVEWKWDWDWDWDWMW
jgi:hypothetical protein